MSEAKPDRRLERTRKALDDAFVALFFERGYEAMSVADIIERANVGRSTFYEHYAGKEALLRETLARPFGALIRLAGAGASRAEVGGMLGHFIGHGKFARALINGPTRPAMARCLAELIEPQLPAGTTPLLPRAMVAAQLAEAQLALIGQWLTTRAVSAETLAEALTAMTDATLSALLRRP